MAINIMAICRYLQNSEAPQHKMSQYLGVYISSFEPFAHTHTLKLWL